MRDLDPAISQARKILGFIDMWQEGYVIERCSDWYTRNSAASAGARLSCKSVYTTHNIIPMIYTVTELYRVGIKHSFL